MAHLSREYNYQLVKAECIILHPDSALHQGQRSPELDYMPPVLTPKTLFNQMNEKH